MVGAPNSLYFNDATGAIAVPGAYACLGIVWLWGRKIFRPYLIELSKTNAPAEPGHRSN